MSPKKSPTQAEIARLASVTPSVVSVVLSGVESSTLSVSEATRANVLEIASSLGYAPRRRNFRHKASASKNRNVLLVKSQSKQETGAHWVSKAYETLIGQIISETSRHLAGHGIGISIHHLPDVPKSLLEYLADSDVMGVIWMAFDTDDAVLQWVASRYPLVVLNRHWHECDYFDSVDVHQEKNITIAAEYLWKAGHRRIATFGHCPTNSIFQRRIEGYRRFVREKNLRDYEEFRQLCDDQSYPADQKVTDILRLWRELGKEAPTALILSDVFALRLLAVARREGIDIPGQLSVVGIDNTSPCPLVEPALSSMEQPFEEICREAVELLMRRTQHRNAPSKTVQIAPRLELRESVRILDGAHQSVLN